MTQKLSYTVKEISCNPRIFGQAYIPDGDGRFPLLIHSNGFGSTHEGGKKWAEYFAPLGIAVYIFDFPNGSRQSLSGNDMTKMSIETEHQNLNCILQTALTWDFVDPQKIILQGSSQGAFVSTLTALDFQDIITGLVLIYPAYFIPDSVRSLFTSRSDIPATFTFLGETVGKMYADDIWDLDIMALLPSYKKPVVIVHGDHDTTADITYSQRSVSLFPDAEFHTIKGGSHGFFGEYLTAALKLISQYLKRLDLLS